MPPPYSQRIESYRTNEILSHNRASREATASQLVFFYSCIKYVLIQSGKCLLYPA